MSRSVLPITNASRKIVGLMSFSVIFTVVGISIRRNSDASYEPRFSDARVILGGTIGAALLSFLAETGPAGQQLGVGLAGITCATAVLVNGGPVWAGINGLFGSKPTGSTGQTAPTGGTHPTTTGGIRS